MSFFLLNVFAYFTTTYIIRQENKKDNCYYYAGFENNSVTYG